MKEGHTQGKMKKKEKCRKGENEYEKKKTENGESEEENGKCGNKEL